MPCGAAMQTEYTVYWLAALTLGQLCLCDGYQGARGLTRACLALFVLRCWVDIAVGAYSPVHLYSRAGLGACALVLMSKAQARLLRYHDYHAGAAGLVAAGVFGLDTWRLARPYVVEAWVLWSDVRFW